MYLLSIYMYKLLQFKVKNTSQSHFLSCQPSAAPHNLSSPKLHRTEHEPDNLTVDMLPDPFLKSGSFVDANPSNAESLANVDHQPIQPLLTRQSDNGAPDFVATSRILNSANPNMPALENVGSLADLKPRRRVVPTESWLPPGWLVEDKVRTSGATAGTVNKYYIDPASGRRFRSKNEVLYYVEHGTLPKRRKKMGNSDVDMDTFESSGGNKQKKSGTKTKTSYSFDFVNAPEKINWVLTDTSKESWTPFVGDEKVRGSISGEWGAVFTSVTARNGGQTMF